MEKSKFIRICVIAGLITAAVVALYDASNQLLVYHFFKFEYYVTGIAVAALAAGIVLASYYYKNKTELNPAEDGIGKLTAREARVLEQIYAGRTNKEIAALNYVELSTVKTHINNIYTKMGVKNRREVVSQYQAYLETQKSTLSPPAVI